MNEPDDGVFPKRVLHLFWVAKSHFDGEAHGLRFRKAASFEVHKLIAQDFELFRMAESKIVEGEISAHGPAVPGRWREKRN